MKALYSTIVCFHVITAILGLGPLTGVAIATTRHSSGFFPWDHLTRLMRIAGWSLVVMLVTGAGLIAMTHGALGDTGWMRMSFALFLFLGLLHGLATRQLRRGKRAMPPGTPANSLSRILWTMCAVVAAIAYLMEAKP